MEINIPIEIKNILGNTPFIKDNIGRSDDFVYIFDNKYILKISKDINKLTKEKEKNDWLCQHIPGPKSILLITQNNYIYYLRECLSGKSLQKVYNPKRKFTNLSHITFNTFFYGLVSP